MLNDNEIRNNLEMLIDKDTEDTFLDQLELEVTVYRLPDESPAVGTIGTPPTHIDEATVEICEWDNFEFHQSGDYITEIRRYLNNGECLVLFESGLIAIINLMDKSWICYSLDFVQRSAT